MAETLEERAKAFAVGKVGSELGHGAKYFEDLYIQIATEQDRIARAEERERCIKAAQEAHCELCGKDADYKCYCLTCLQREEIRKAIEKGGEQ